MSTVKTFKRGEALFKEGEKALSIYLIHSGSVQLQLQRQKQTIDICTLGKAQIAGEHALSGAATHPHTAIATSEVNAVELPVEALKKQVEEFPQMQKVLVKSMTDKLKLVMKDFQSMKLERDTTPCPPEQTAKIFGTVFHVVKSKGEAIKDKPNHLRANWNLCKQYAQRVFLESPKRLQMAVNVFVKLGWAKYEMQKPEDNPEGTEEIFAVVFEDLPIVEQFFEFYQYYHFKGGKQDLLKTDDRMILLVRSLLEFAATATPDRHGAVRLEYGKVLEHVKATLGVQLNNDHWSVLENKGLFVKRNTATEGGVFLHFDLKEFERTEKIWRVLREVERWNEKGFVDPNEKPVEPKKAQKAGPCCPACSHVYEGAPKFCSECGHKFVSAA